jgi:hypothetical protein
MVADLAVNFFTSLSQQTTVCRPWDISRTSKGSVIGAAASLSMTDERGVTARPKRFRGKTKALSLLPVTVKSALPVTDESALPVTDESALPVTEESALPVTDNSDKGALAVTAFCLSAVVCHWKTAFV